VQLPLLLLELWVGWPGLALSACVLALVGLRREWVRLLHLAPWLQLLPLPTGLFLLAVFVNAGDFRAGPGGASFRFGADVSDRALYAMIAREIGRIPPPHTENPLFAGAPITYSFFPSLLALLFERYGGIAPLSTFLLPLPAIALAFTGLAADRLLAAMAVLSARARAASVLLAVLGGELAWLVPAPNVSALERTRFISLFWSQSEWLFFNTWMLAAPLALALLSLASLWLRSERRGDLLLAGLLAGALFETKVFTLIPILAGAAGLAVLRPRRATALLLLALALGCAPWLAFTWLSAGGDTGFLSWAPLLAVARLLERVPSLGFAAGTSSVVLLAAATLLFLMLGFGPRLLGAGCLLREAVRDLTGYALFVFLTMAIGIGLSLTVAVRPIWYDNAQFQLLPRLVLWLYTAPALFAALRQPRWRWLSAVTLVSVSVTPLYYIAVKKWPEAFTASGSWDRKRQDLSPASVGAALWLEAHAGRDDRLAMPLYDDPEDQAGMKAFYVSALARRPILASLLAFHVPLEQAAARGNDAIALYSTGDRETAAGILDRWRIRWVWENAATPLRFNSPRLRLAFSAPGVRLYEYR
jgi:hypothetical protein